MLTHSVNIYTCFSLWQTQTGGTWLCANGILLFVFVLPLVVADSSVFAVEAANWPFPHREKPRRIINVKRWSLMYHFFFFKWLLMYWSGCAIGRLVLVFKWPVLLFGEEILLFFQFDKTQHSKQEQMRNKIATYVDHASIIKHWVSAVGLRIYV